MKTLNRNGRNWNWPDEDEKMLICFKHVLQLPEYLKYVKKFDVCIQAGGAGGVFAEYLADHFKDVYTFEPAPHYECLKANITKSNIHHKNVALGSSKSFVSLVSPKDQNCGMIYTVPGNDVPCVRLDDEVKSVDFMLLDIEGDEELALRGAERLINECSPVIAIEDKPLNQGRKGDPTEYLRNHHGYKLAERIERDNICVR